MADETYDPKEFTVDQVNEYLSTAGPDEVARVLGAEEDGFQRKGILSGPHAAVVEEATPEELLGEDDPYEVVRAKDAAGNEYNATRVAALAAGSTVLTKPAFDGFGQPIPTKSFLDLRAEDTTATTTSEEN